MKGTLIAFLAVVALAVMALPAHAAVYDLATDWSDAQNPFGDWTLMKSPTAAYTINQPDYLSVGVGQRAWADEPFDDDMHVPMWLKVSIGSTGIDELDAMLSQVQIGDIIAHGAEFDRTGTNQTSAIFTSPSAGTINITGALWSVTNYDRQMSWELRKNGEVLSGGTLVSDGTYSLDNPFGLADGTGGATVLTQNVLAGDKIELALISDSEDGNLGDALGVRFAVSANGPQPAVPEPSAFLLAFGGTGVAALLRRRGR